MGTTRPSRYRAANDEATATPCEKLQSFIAKHARHGVDIEHSTILIEETLARFNSFLLAGKDISEKAKQIANAATKFARALKSACAIYTDCDGISREGQASVWPYLRTADLMGSGGFGKDTVSALRFGESSRPAQHFDLAAGKAPAFLFQVCAIERQASIASAAFSPQNCPPNTKTAQLRYEFEGIWKNLSGKKPGYSGAMTFDSPRSHFGAFVKLAINTTDWDSQKREEVFRQLMGRKTPKK